MFCMFCFFIEPTSTINDKTKKSRHKDSLPHLVPWNVLPTLQNWFHPTETCTNVPCVARFSTFCSANCLSWSEMRDFYAQWKLSFRTPTAMAPAKFESIFLSAHSFELCFVHFFSIVQRIFALRKKIFGVFFELVSRQVSSNHESRLVRTRGIWNSGQWSIWSPLESTLFYLSDLSLVLVCKNSKFGSLLAFEKGAKGVLDLHAVVSGSTRPSLAPILCVPPPFNCQSRC